MNSARTATDTRYRILVYLLTAVLVLSTGLNFYLLRGSTAAGEQEESADAEELAAVESELVRARRQLARCQSMASASDTLALHASE
ncbi:hypothetical protein Q5H93_08730 [Hymenobacter sp. ASUV-10]|uniref:Uncharacterized protein n=1 Tax=Hymenobacter aranciens TaxID=3063996 RepID=A0ABT9BCS3_9BACT|nr:hypothetical protein [Hymenobacter sp. ASUV-10]MDO7874812.1 hypothetical protein [Hymenobacter sp. ASUV-10]